MPDLYPLHRFRYWTVLSLLVLSGGLAAQPADTLELERFLDLAVEQALGRQAAERDLRVAQLNYGVFRASLLPQISGSANFPNYSRTFGEITQPDGTVRFQPVRNNNSALGLNLSQAIPGTGGVLFVQSSLQRFDDLASDFYLYNGLPFRVGLLQPIFAFNPIKWDRRIEPLLVTEAEKQYVVDKELVRATATQLYFDLLLAEQEYGIASTNLTANERLYTIAQERYELGKISRRDLVQLELEKISAERARLRAEQSVSEASAAVATYLGLDPQSNAFVPAVPPTSGEHLITEGQALDWARTNRPEWTAFTRRRLEADRAVDQARKTDGPQLDLTASVGRVRSSSDLAEIYQDALPEEFVQLRLSLPIVDWGQRRKRMQIAQAELEYTSMAVEREALSLENAVRQTVRDFQTLQQELEMAQRVQELSEERFRITTESYVLGATPLAELTLAQREKDQAVRAYISTLRAYWTAYADLRQLTLRGDRF
ncbi:MAG: TolC family protein [Lewinella sp.]|nr:TolC family protein [Lewinella sp.]